MQEIELRIRAGESLADVEASLEGQVFHVTSRAYWPAIVQSGQIEPNTDGKLPTTFGSSRNSYFRNRGCVCLFDYRQPPDENICFSRTKCWPFQPDIRASHGLTFAFIAQEALSRLVPWTRWKEEHAIGEMVVPHVEAGHPGPIALSDIERVVHVLVEENPSSTAFRLKHARQGKSAG